MVTAECVNEQRFANELNFISFVFISTAPKG